MASDPQVPRTVCFASRKGGAGKSTLAIHLFMLLRALRVPVRFVDCDPQQSAVAWGERELAHDRRLGYTYRARVQKFEPVLRAQLGPALALESAWSGLERRADIVSAFSRSALLRSQRDDCVMLYDTAGDLSGTTAAALGLADLVVVPVRPSQLDVHSSVATIEAAAAAGRPAVMLLSAVPSARLEAQGRRLVRLSGAPILDPVVRTRVAYVDTIACGSTVWAPGRHTAARRELAAVFSSLLLSAPIP